MRSIDVVVEAVVTFAGAAGFAHTLAPLRRGQQDPCFRVPGDGTIWRTSLLPTGPVTARISRAGRDAARCVAWGSGAEEFVDMAPAMLGAADDASDFVPLHPAVAAAHRRLPNLRLGRTGQVQPAPPDLGWRADRRAPTRSLRRCRDRWPPGRAWPRSMPTAPPRPSSPAESPTDARNRWTRGGRPPQREWESDSPRGSRAETRWCISARGRRRRRPGRQ